VADTDGETGATPDLKAILERFKLPGFDLEAFVDARKADIEAVSHATAATVSETQKIAAIQGDLLKRVFDEVGEALHSFEREAGNPAELLKKQQELTQKALTHALASMKDIAETARKSQADILALASERVHSSIDEIRRLAKKPGSDTKADP
jgi:phasin family protein